MGSNREQWVPHQIRDDDLQESPGGLRLLLSETQILDAEKLFRDNPTLRGEPNLRLRKKDYFFVDASGKYVIVPEEEVDQANTAAALRNKYKIPAGVPLDQIKSKLHLTVCREGTSPDDKLFAVYYGRKGHPHTGKSITLKAGAMTTTPPKIVQCLTKGKKGEDRRGEWGVLKVVEDEKSARRESSMNRILNVGDKVGLFAKVMTRGLIPHRSPTKSNRVSFVVEWIPSKGDLHDYLTDKSRPRLSFEERLNVCERLIEQLDRMHGKNLVHRDIKPENIILSDSGEAYLIDHGMTDRADKIPEGNLSAGTPRWTDPLVLYSLLRTKNKEEQAKLLKARDVYAVGAIMWALLGLDIPWSDSVKPGSVFGIGITQGDVNFFKSQAMKDLTPDQKKQLEAMKKIVTDMVSIYDLDSQKNKRVNIAEVKAEFQKVKAMMAEAKRPGSPDSGLAISSDGEGRKPSSP